LLISLPDSDRAWLFSAPRSESAMEASGRQPEVAGQVRVSMIIAAALIEGATFFALAICIILALKA
jgi:F-type H+-transporting ATPase subunit c